MTVSRRSALLGLASVITLGRARLALAAADTDSRFVVCLLRGALDGMSAVVPYGDAGLADLRAALLPPQPGQPNGLLDLGGFFGLHPSLVKLHEMYAANDMMPVHAVAGPYRSRSHFEAQDLMEIGAEQRMTSGWLNRATQEIPKRASGETAFALASSPPLLLRGKAPVNTWLPSPLRHPDTDFYQRLAVMHGDDGAVSKALMIGLADRGFDADVLAGKVAGPQAPTGLGGLAFQAGRLLASAEGPRIAAMETPQGWDTHVGQVPRLIQALRVLDDSMAQLKAGLGDAWGKTVVMVITEFGRTARVNGSNGTDHGTGTVAFLLGGAVAGGKVRADWPGLKPAQLFENRDLQPTADLRSVAKGILKDHLGLNDAALLRVFPGSEHAGAMPGLVRA